MTTQNQNSKHLQDPFYIEDEIELMDYLLILWKWKYLIFIGTLVCAVTAAVISFQMPRIYEVSMIIEPGIIGMQNNGNPVFMDMVNMKEKIKNNVYNSRILKRLNIDIRPTQLEFKVANLKKSQLVRIFSEYEQDKTETGKKVLAQLAVEIAYDVENIFKPKKDDLDRRILLKLGDIQEKKNQIKLQETILKNIRERKTELIQELRKVKDNTESLIQQKNRIVEGESSGENVSLLLYFTTVQQNLAYFNELKDQLNGLKIKDDNNVMKIKSLEKYINDIKIEIERLNIKKSYIENFKVLNRPEASEFPVKPKKRRNVMLAAVVGLFLMLFLAFIIEYVSKYKTDKLKHKTA